MTCFILALMAVLNGCKKDEELKSDFAITKKNNKLYSGFGMNTLSGLPNLGLLSNVDAYNALSKEEKIFYLIVTNSLENGTGINPNGHLDRLTVSLTSIDFDLAELHLNQPTPNGGGNGGPPGPSLPNFMQIMEYPYGMSGVPPYRLDYTEGNSFRNYDELIPIIKNLYQLYFENKNQYSHNSYPGMYKPLYFFITKNEDINGPFYSMFQGQESYPDHSPGPLNIHVFELAQMQRDEVNTEAGMRHLREISSGCQVDRKKYKEATNLPQSVVSITPCSMMSGY